MRYDDVHEPGDDRPGRIPDDAEDGPVGTPVLPGWVGDRRERARLAVDRLLPTRAARLAGAAYVLVTLAHLVLVMPYLGLLDPVVVAGVGVDLPRVTQSVMMPLLALTFFLATPPYRLAGKPRERPRLVLLVFLALGLGWAGDTAPGLVPPDLTFLAMIGPFLLAQVAYVLAFRPFAASSPVRRVPVVAAYGVVGLAVVGACAPQLVASGASGAAYLAGLIVYCAVICTMAILAWGVHRLAGIGAIVFLVSDAVIALTSFTAAVMWEPFAMWSGVLVMTTYGVAQALIVVGVLRRVLR
ncbi:lysoplasmalogenase [Myceligenerans crystallogenes]|uniref:YhhN-like protein n=1 Tax=Myceligenerans crystallogenes TaxID=316335 RepID=A0ABP4ZX21_9MICO